jgi:hypothetical protein
MMNMKILSHDVLAQLDMDVEKNLARYRKEDFLDLEKGAGWSLEAPSVTVDLDLLSTLRNEPEARKEGESKSSARERRMRMEAINSKIVFDALPGLSRGMARQEQVWARLAHVECLEYSRARWIRGSSDEADIKDVRKHLFARGTPGVRDDNAIGRLWWNCKIAEIGTPAGMKVEDTLSLVLSRANIRFNLVERPRLFSRPRILRGAVRMLALDPWLIQDDKNFGEFAKTLNRDGSGILFETMSPVDVDDFMKGCIDRARGNVSASEMQPEPQASKPTDVAGSVAALAESASRIVWRSALK